MQLKDLKVGDSVYLSRRSDVAGLHKVAKVGRKYLYLEGRRNDGYDRETGRINDDYGNEYVYTVEEWKKKEAAARAEKQLSDWGMQFSYGIVARQSREKAPQIVAAIKHLFEEEKTS